jgi:hypothetical protein
MPKHRFHGFNPQVLIHFNWKAFTYIHVRTRTY